MTQYAPYPAASAVVLQDVGTTVLKDLGDKWGVEFDRHRRIKIFDATAFDQGNLTIYYRTDPAIEKISDMEAQLILPNGERLKIKGDNIFTENVNPAWSVKKIFIPNLQPGSILEYRYHIHSENIVTLADWYFQSELPTRWSEFTTVVPIIFEYANLINRPKDFDLLESEETTSLAANGSRISAKMAHYGLSNLPPLKVEPFMTTIDDYKAHIGFQLSTINYTDRPTQRFMSTWENLARSLEGHEKLGYQYLKSARFEKAWQAFVDYVGPVSDKSIIPASVLKFVCSNIKWNGEYRMFMPETIDAAFERRTGSSADVNLTMVALLRKAGIDAVPVLISTRSHGSIHPQYPFYEQFNSVVAYIRQGSDTGILLDATDPFQPVNELRDQHYNGGGWQLDSKNPQWLVLHPPLISEVWYGNLRLFEDGSMTGKFTIEIEGPFAADWRHELEHKTPKQVLKKRFAASYPDVIYDSIVVTNQTAIVEPIQVGFKCRIPNTANALNNFLYCKPVLDFFMLENPFKSLKRIFPVNFPYFHRAHYILNLELPLGYTLVEVPPSEKIVLPHDGGKLAFSITQTGQRQVQLTLKMEISQLDFMPEDYDKLRQFFDLMVEKTQLQLVLQKS